MAFFDAAVWWVFSTGGFIILAAVIVLGVWQTVRAKTAPTWFVLSMACTTLWWMEPYGDWGSYVLYNPSLPQIPWWGISAYTAPSKPLGMIPGYCWFYLLWTMSGLLLVKAILAKRPTWNPTRTCIAACTILWVIWDVGIEFSMAHAGVWSYIEVFGPALRAERGQFPLIWPLINQIPFMVLLVWLMLMRDEQGLTPLDHRFVSIPAHRLGERWNLHFEFTRLAIWVIAFTIIFATALIIPQMLFRVWFGVPSELIP